MSADVTVCQEQRVFGALEHPDSIPIRHRIWSRHGMCLVGRILLYLTPEFPRTVGRLSAMAARGCHHFRKEDATEGPNICNHLLLVA